MATITKFENSKILFLLCSSKDNILSLEHDSRSKNISISIFNKYFRVSILNRIRQIIKIIITGNPYLDQIILDGRQVKELKDFLDSV